VPVADFFAWRSMFSRTPVTFLSKCEFIF
jgi:hypothetical protein